jgi:hypothetical protein
VHLPARVPGAHARRLRRRRRGCGGAHVAQFVRGAVRSSYTALCAQGAGPRGPGGPQQPRRA